MWPIVTILIHVLISLPFGFAKLGESCSSSESCGSNEHCTLFGNVCECGLAYYRISNHCANIVHTVIGVMVSFFVLMIVLICYCRKKGMDQLRRSFASQQIQQCTPVMPAGYVTANTSNNIATSSNYTTNYAHDNRADSHKFPPQMPSAASNQYQPAITMPYGNTNYPSAPMDLDLPPPPYPYEKK